MIPGERMDSKELQRMANKLRLHVVEMTYAANSGHPGGSLSAADIISALYFKVMRHDPKNPNWEDRDRFILSKGHVAPVLYAALAESGFFPVEDIPTECHPFIHQRFQRHDLFGIAAYLQSVAVHYRNQVVELVVGCEHGSIRGSEGG